MFRFRRIKKWLFAAEPLATPWELAQRPAAWREVFRSRDNIALDQVRRFERTTIGDGIELYSAAKGARTLIVGLTDRNRRILMPAAIFLQHLDDSLFDVLMLNDPKQQYFDCGAGEDHSSFAALIATIADLRRSRGYSSMITYGTSMGGLPALRVGHALRADRAISVGGNYAWHIARLKSGKKLIGAFDPICECGMPLRCKAYLLYPEEHTADADDAARVVAVAADATLVAVPGENHIFPYAIYKSGGLEAYHQELFDLHRTPDAAKLRALVECANGPLPKRVRLTREAG